MWELLQFPAVLGYCRSDSFRCAVWHLMSGLGKGVSGVVRISWNGSGAGTFPDTYLCFPVAENHSAQCHKRSFMIVITPMLVACASIKYMSPSWLKSNWFSFLWSLLLSSISHMSLKSGPTMYFLQILVASKYMLPQGGFFSTSHCTRFVVCTASSQQRIMLHLMRCWIPSCMIWYPGFLVIFAVSFGQSNLSKSTILLLVFWANIYSPECVHTSHSYVEDPWYVDKPLEVILGCHFDATGFFHCIVLLLHAEITMTEMDKFIKPWTGCSPLLFNIIDYVSIPMSKRASWISQHFHCPSDSPHTGGPACCHANPFTGSSSTLSSSSLIPLLSHSQKSLSYLASLMHAASEWMIKQVHTHDSAST